MHGIKVQHLIHYRVIILEGKSLLLAPFWQLVGQCGQLL